MSDSPDGRRLVTISDRFHLATTVRGAKNPVMVGPTETLWSTRTPDGPGSLVLERIGDTEVEALAWGPGTEWLLEQAPRLLGNDDDLTGFEPTGDLGRRWRRRPFLLARTDRLWDAVIGGVFGQKVQVQRAVKARRMLARRYGEPAPGPHRAWVLPAPERVAEMGYYEFHPLGVEKKRADILLRVAREFPRIERSLGAEPTPEALQSRLRHVRGIGVWTAEIYAKFSLGRADAFAAGDLALQESARRLFELEDRPTERELRKMAEAWSPWRSVAARILWAYYCVETERDGVR